MLLDIRADHLKIVQDILKAHVPDREVWAFGSRAKWQAKEYSDLDLCILGDSPLGFDTLGLMAEAFDESDLPYKVDLVDWATTSESFRKIMERDRVVVQKMDVNSEWKKGRLGDFIELKRGYDLPQAKRKNGLVPLVSSSGVSDRHSVAMVKGPGVVTGRYGTIGQVFYVEDDFWPLNTTLYVRDFKGNDQRFAHYLLKTVDFFAYSDKAAVPGVNRNHLHEALVTMPPLGVQQEIAKILGALDSRITLLRETNVTLEAIAQALFKSWFVDFDPVRAKMEGRAPEGMDEATAALFPDSFEETALGRVPKGWRVGSLADISVLNARSWTARNHPNDISYVDLASVKNNVFDIPQIYSFDDAPSRARRVLNAGDCIIGTVRPGNKSFGFISASEMNLTGSTGFAVLSPKQGQGAAFIYLCATRDENIDRLASLADGGAYPAVKPELVTATVCVLPTDEVMHAFDGAVRPLLDAIAANSAQAQTLAALRDTLLPRLISGQLRVGEAAHAL